MNMCIHTYIYIYIYMSIYICMYPSRQSISFRRTAFVCTPERCRSSPLFTGTEDTGKTPCRLLVPLS